MENDIERFGNSLNAIIEEEKAKFNQFNDLQSLCGNIKNTYLFKCDKPDNKNDDTKITCKQYIFSNKRASISEKLKESDEDAAKRFEKILSKTNLFTKKIKDEVNLPLKKSEDKPIFVGLSKAENIIPRNHPRINSPTRKITIAKRKMTIHAVIQLQHFINNAGRNIIEYVEITFIENTTIPHYMHFIFHSIHIFNWDGIQKHYTYVFHGERLYFKPNQPAIKPDK